MEANETKYPRSVTALLRRSDRNEQARARKETFQRRWKEEREQLLQENERLRRENTSSLRLLLHMTRRFEKLRSYTETLRNWIADRAQRGPTTEKENDT